MPLPWSMVTTHPHMLSFSTESTVPALIALTASPFFAQSQSRCAHANHPWFWILPFRRCEIFVDFCSQRQHEIFRLRLPFCRGGCLLLLRSPLVGHAGCRHVCGRLLRLTGALFVRASICEFAPERPCVTGARPCTAPQTPKPTASKQHPSAI